MNKRQREILTLITGTGLRCVSIEQAKTTHYRAVVEGPHGRACVTFSSTPGDHRGDFNKRAHLRRIAAGQEGRIG